MDPGTTVRRGGSTDRWGRLRWSWLAAFDHAVHIVQRLGADVWAQCAGSASTQTQRGQKLSEQA